MVTLADTEDVTVEHEVRWSDIDGMSPKMVATGRDQLIKWATGKLVEAAMADEAVDLSAVRLTWAVGDDNVHLVMRYRRWLHPDSARGHRRRYLEKSVRAMLEENSGP